MLWISRNEALKALSERLDQDVSNPAFCRLGIMLLLNISDPQLVPCLRVLKRSQHWPFDPDFGKELLLESRITLKGRS